jgi:riboflavin biosynthesis pyrimidine reductase
VRVLLNAADPALEGRAIGDDDLAALYAPPSRPWLRANMVSTLDGAATGPDDRSGSINNEVDHSVFDTLRGAADVVVVGAGTARAEGYEPTRVPIVVVSRSGEVPPLLRDAGPGRVLLATCEASPGLSAARDELGEQDVLVVGEQDVDAAALRAALLARGHRELLAEGGPSLLADLLAAGVVDELCLTWVPRVLGGDHPVVVAGPALDVQLRPLLLLEHQGTLLGRWQVVAEPGA